MKISLTFNDLDPATAAKMLAQFGGTAAPPAAPAPTQTAPSAPPPPNAAPSAPPAPVAPPVAPAVPAAPPPPAPVAPAAPPAAVPGAPTHQSVLADMQAYAQAGHKAAGAKRLLAKCGITQVTQATPEVLAWLAQAFQSKLPPEHYGA